VTPAEGRVAISRVTNRRPQDRGGGNSTLVGYWRSSLEERTPFKVDDESGPLQLAMRNLVGDALRSAGIGVTDADDPSATALLDVDVLDLWSDMTTPAIGRVALELIVRDPTTRVERTRVSVEGEGEIGPSRLLLSKECKKAITSPSCAYFVLALNDVYGKIVNAFQRPDVRVASGKKEQPGGD
jgi:hypothetical protein